MGWRARPFSRYSRWRPRPRTSTAPTSRSTRRCFDTWGCASPSSRTRAVAGRPPPARTSRICRRRGSATALNASAVVADRAIGTSYSHIGICQQCLLLQVGEDLLGGSNPLCGAAFHEPLEVGRAVLAGEVDVPLALLLVSAEGGVLARFPV